MTANYFRQISLFYLKMINYWSVIINYELLLTVYIGKLFSYQIKNLLKKKQQQKNPTSILSQIKITPNLIIIPSLENLQMCLALCMMSKNCTSEVRASIQPACENQTVKSPHLPSVGTLQYPGVCLSPLLLANEEVSLQTPSLRNTDSWYESPQPVCKNTI